MSLCVVCVVCVLVLPARPLSSRYARDAFFFFQAEDGIRDLVRSRGLGDVYKRQGLRPPLPQLPETEGADERDTAPEDPDPERQGRGLSLIHI